MTFVIGDIHANKEKYFAMLEKLAPTDEDAVFVLGNVIATGEGGIEILKDMMYRSNLFPILGEHEYYAKKLFPLIAKADTVDGAKALLSGEDRELFEKWLSMKSEKTVSDFLSLDEENKESIIDYLSEFTPYEEIEAGEKTFVLVHAGIDNFDENKTLDDYAEEDFVFAKTDYGKVYFSDSYLVTGHTPTALIDRSLAGKVYAKKRHLALDCGVSFGGKLAAVCLEKLKVYYC